MVDLGHLAMSRTNCANISGIGMIHIVEIDYQASGITICENISALLLN